MPRCSCVTQGSSASWSGNLPQDIRGTRKVEGLDERSCGASWGGAAVSSESQRDKQKERGDTDAERERETWREKRKKSRGVRKNFECSIFSQEAVRWSRRKWRCGACAATTRTPPLWGTAPEGSRTTYPEKSGIWVNSRRVVKGSWNEGSRRWRTEAVSSDQVAEASKPCIPSHQSYARPHGGFRTTASGQPARAPPQHPIPHPPIGKILNPRVPSPAPFYNLTLIVESRSADPFKA